jgi:hypothetical protein
LRGLDLNQRPSGYEPDELPGCSTPRVHYGEMMRGIKLKAVAGRQLERGKAVSHAAIRVINVTIFSINSTILA